MDTYLVDALFFQMTKMPSDRKVKFEDFTLANPVLMAGLLMKVENQVKEG